MTFTNIWLVDRSRREEGTDHCQTARYYKYHFGGYGIVPSVPPLDPYIGIAVHGILADTVTQKKWAVSTADTWKKRLQRIAEKREESFHTQAEVGAFAEALAYSWWVMFERWLFDRFEIVHVEQEFTRALDDGRILLMSKPDLVLRDLTTKKLTFMDWKTMSSFNEETTPAQFRENVQFALMAAVIEEALDEPVETYWVAGLVKGSRRLFMKDGQQTPESRYHSHLLYAQPPEAPFRKTWETKGYWYHKAPVWEKMSPTAWVDTLAAENKALLVESNPMMGPFRRQDHMIEQALTGLVAGENRWIQALWNINQGADATAEFDRSYGHCTNFYGGECPFLRLCYALPGHTDPLGSGYYLPRRPHHEAELLAMKEHGFEIPKEPWE